MAQIKKISTELQLLDKFLDTSGDAGTSGQVLSSTGTGINWVSGGSLPGGPYLPLSAGSSYPLTDTLYGTKATFGDTNIDVATVTIEGGQAGILDIWRNGTNASYQAIRFRDDTNANTEASIGWGSNQLRLNGTSTIVATTGGSERMRITSGGNVGIGTTSPNGRLQFSNDAETRKIVLWEGYNNDYQFYGFGIESSTLVYTTYGAGDDHVFFVGTSGTSRNELMRIKSTGSVIVGEATVAAANAAADNIVIKGEGAAVGLTISNSVNSGTGTIFFGDAASSTVAGFRYNHNTGDMAISAEDNVTFACDRVGIGNTSPNYRLSVSGGIEAGGVVTYSKSAGSLNTTGYAIAGLGTVFNGASAFFTFTASGGIGQYQKVVYSCAGAGTNWVVSKVIDEGTNVLDIEASSSSAATIVFTFKTRSGTQAYSPRVVIEATGHSIISTYA